MTIKDLEDFVIFSTKDQEEYLLLKSLEGFEQASKDRRQVLRFSDNTVIGISTEEAVSKILGYITRRSSFS